jgi:AraC-like DNA-binding protein
LHPPKTAAPTPSEAVDHNILRFFSDLVRDLGGDPDILLREGRVDPEAFRAGRVEITYPMMVELVTLAAARLGCSDFGMQLARRQAGQIRSPLVALMESCSTLGEALQQVTEHSYAHSAAAAIWLDKSGADDRVAVGHDILLQGLPNRTQAMEHILLIAHLSIGEIAGGQVRAREVQFRHQPLSTPAVYRRHFGCEVTFGRRRDALILRRRDLACPTRHADSAGFAAAVASIEARDFPRSPFHANVRSLVMRLIGTDQCNTSEVSSRLGIQVRAMHRRLAAEGAAFQQIKTEVRRDLAGYYLADTDLDLGRISRRLGFAEQSAFTAFCRKWLADAPSHIRRRARRTAPSKSDPPVRNEQV